MGSWRHRVLLMFVMMNIKSALLSAQDHDLPTHFYELTKANPEHVIYKGSGRTRTLALTFDDGPTDMTPDILELLDNYQAKATFFWQGSNMTLHPEIVRRAIEEGHEIANHSWDHPNGLEMEPYQLWKTQVRPTISVYGSITGEEINLYRPPYGAITEEQLDFLKNQGITTVLWSHTTMDWDTKRNSCKALYERFVDGLHPGAIVLMHDMDFDDTRSEKLCGLEKIIQHAEGKGYAFRTVGELINGYE